MPDQKRHNQLQQRMLRNFEQEARRTRKRRLIIFFAALLWLTLLFGDSLRRQSKLLARVYENAALQSQINQLRMSNAELKEELYKRTDLQAIEEAAYNLGMIPAAQASQILIPIAKNDEIFIRLESADAEVFGSVSRQTPQGVYHNLEDYYQKKEIEQLLLDRGELEAEIEDAEDEASGTEGGLQVTSGSDDTNDANDAKDAAPDAAKDASDADDVSGSNDGTEAQGADE